MNHSLNLVGMDPVITTKTPRRSRRLAQRGMPLRSTPLASWPR